MGAQWKHAGKSENAAKRGAIVGKITREISVAAKMGDPNPDFNPRLRAAVEAAKKQSVTRDTIERAIKKGAGLLDEVMNYETVTFEGFTPHKVPIIVECLTENRNRTSSDIKSIFRKGSMGAIGSVAWMFQRLGIVEATTTAKGVDIEEVAIEAGAQNVESLGTDEIPEGGVGAKFLTEPSDLDAVTKFLNSKGWSVTKSELGFVPKDFPTLTSEQAKEVADFLNELDDNDDVHRIHVAMK